jgi:hypothetical protein
VITKCKEIWGREFNFFPDLNLLRMELEYTFAFYAQVARTRVSKNSWHLDSKDEVFERLTNRVGDMSGLSMKTAEQWQNQNYGIGGHYVGKEYFEKMLPSKIFKNMQKFEMEDIIGF